MINAHPRSWHYAAALLVLAVCSSVTLSHAREDTGEPEVEDSLELDYGDQLPRIPPTRPDEAIATFTVADGFRMDQVAAEPLVTDPIAMAFDARGRLYVVEMRGYSEDAADNLGRIRLLEDTDDDGRYDEATIFADGLSWPTAIACYDEGVFVGAAPDILYLKDTTGDRQADVHRRVFTGFKLSNVQGLLNSFEWGLDNRIHAATSSSGAEVTRVVDGKPVGEPLPLAGRDFAINPRTLEIVPESGGGQHGLSFNRWGEKFVCHNSDHLQLVFTPERYLSRNPYQAMPSARRSIAADGPQAEVFRNSPIEPWRIARTRLRVKGLVPGPVEGGGRAAGYFTSATGITVYEGDAWPEEYRGWVIVADVGSNLVHRKRLDRNGTSYIGYRVDQASEFITSTDIWFRPVQMTNGPDGGLYIADMYREVIEHPASLPPILKKHLDLTSGRDRGRIYRVVPEGFQHRPTPDLTAASTAKLVELLDHQNAWHRRTAARLLFERQDTSVAERLRVLARDAHRPEGRLAALRALEGMGKLTEDTISAAARDPHPQVRRTALRLTESFVNEEFPGVPFVHLAVDPDPAIRRQMAFSLGEFGNPESMRLLGEMAAAHLADHEFLVAVRTSLGQGVAVTLEALLADDRVIADAAGRQLVADLLRQLGKQQLPADVDALTRLVKTLAESRSPLLPFVYFQLEIDSDDPLYQRLLAATGGEAQKAIDQALDNALKTAVDESTQLSARLTSLHTLRWAQWESVEKLAPELFLPSQPTGVQLALLATLRHFTEPAVATLLIDTWPTFSPQLKSAALDVLMSREPFTLQLIEAVKADRIALAELTPARLDSLRTHPKPAIREAAEPLTRGTARTQSEEELLTRYRQAVAEGGNAEQGKAVFTKHCATCHRVELQGHELGPNLAAMIQRGQDATLYNVLFPDKEVDPRYINYVVATVDGQTFNGIIQAESPNSVTLIRGENASGTFLRSEIDILESTGHSLMPSNLDQVIDARAMADLLAYLTAASTK